MSGVERHFRREIGSQSLSAMLLTLSIFLCRTITNDAYAAFPGSPGLIAVQHSPDPRALSSEIWLFDWRTGVGRRLIQRGYDRRPAFSPDGTRIAFVTDVPRGWFNIWSIRSDGSGLKRLTKSWGELGAESPSFSADGQWVAFSGKLPNGERGIQRVPSSGGQARTLVSVGPRMTAADPSFSPDGKSLAWAQWRQESNVPPKVYVGRSNGRGGRSVTSGFDPEFSPDGRSIVFLREGRCRHGGLRTTIALFSLSSGQQRPLRSACGTEISEPTYSPDGAWIAYTAYRKERAEVEIIRIPEILSQITPLTRLGVPPSISAAPSWQPITG